MKLGSLFDGIAGFPLAASRHGIEVVWASEIDPFCIKVSQLHFPCMKHLGSITDINGAEIEPVDIVTFGSPCQDLSVAGKREGLAGERSHLFFKAVDRINEMRKATSGIYPRFALWENVPGALSSNRGRDFRAVLEALSEAKIPMPPTGRWADAGMVRGNGREVAWRCFDAQYWGVPQRRKRIFLVVDFRGERAGEILFEPQSLSWDLAKSGKTREEVAAGAGEGIEGTGRIFYESGPGWISEGVGCLRAEGENRPSRPTHTILEPVAKCVTTGTGRRFDPESETLISVLTDQGGSQIGVSYGVAPTLRAQEHGHQPLIMAFSPGSQHEIAHAIRAQVSKADKPDSTTYIVHPQVTGTLCASAAGMSRPAGMGAVDCRNLCETKNRSGTLQCKQSGGYSLNYQNPVRVGYAVRRLTPLEAERLQGLPDGWTNIPGASDTARYRAIGNSLAIPCVEWLFSRLISAIGGHH